MKSKTIIGTIAGGVAFFLLGWLIYGLLLKDLMAEHSNSDFMLKEEEMVMWAIILSNLIWAYFLTWIIEMKGAKGFPAGMGIGLTVGFITTLSFDLGMFAMSKMFLNFNGLLIDVAANSIMTAIVGGIIGMIMGGKEKDAQTDSA